MPDAAKTIVFTGDSITHCARCLDWVDPMGNGYAMIASALTAARRQTENFIFHNIGIPGDTARLLRARWRQDCLDLIPGFVSVLVGVNDCMQRYTHNAPTTAREFGEHMAAMLEACLAADIRRLLLIEPFLIPVNDEQRRWRKEDLDEKATVARVLADRYGAAFVPAQALFDKAVKSRPPEYWARDGIHPTPAGHAVLAEAWLKEFDKTAW
ncbi:lipase [Clostridia bacterium]|nr:lipase [Clostridia bacterium]